jgi:hypothetical protein
MAILAVSPQGEVRVFMPIKIQHIAIDESKVELIIADAATPEAAATWVQLRVPCPVERNRPLAEAMLKALRLARKAIDDEIEEVGHLRGRTSGTAPQTAGP